MNRYAGLISLLITLSACSTSGPVKELANGDAVRAWRVQQTYDAEATNRNGTTAPQGTDPDVADAALKNLRTGGNRAGDAKTALQALFGGATGTR